MSITTVSNIASSFVQMKEPRQNSHPEIRREGWVSWTRRSVSWECKALNIERESFYYSFPTPIIWTQSVTLATRMINLQTRTYDGRANSKPIESWGRRRILREVRCLKNNEHPCRHQSKQLRPQCPACPRVIRERYCCPSHETSRRKSDRSGNALMGSLSFTKHRRNWTCNAKRTMLQRLWYWYLLAWSWSV